MIAHKLYRLLPKSRRLKMLEVLPPDRRLWLVRRLTRQRALGSPAVAGDLVRARDRGAAVQARVEVGATPAWAWRRNLDAVVAVLDAAEIDYFCVRPHGYQHSAVAVSVEDRARTLSALHGAAGLAGARILAGDVTERGFRAGRTARGGVQVYFPVTDPRGTTVLGSGSACEIEFWRRVPGADGAPDTIVGPRGNEVATALPAEAEIRHVGAATLSPFMPDDDAGPRYRTREEFAGAPAEQVRFPIDAVYTWVDGADPVWQARKKTALAANAWLDDASRLSANDSRYASRDELRYSLRALHCFARGCGTSSWSPTTRCRPGWTPITRGSPSSATARSSAQPARCRPSTRRPSSRGCTASRA